MSAARAAALAICLAAAGAALAQPKEDQGMSFKLASSAFAEGGAIARQYSCEGRDVSPPLAWSGVPPGAKSLALVVEDPDAPDPAAPKMTWVHWIVYNLDRKSVV